MVLVGVFFFSSRRRHTRFDCDWSSDVCSSDLTYKDAPLFSEARAISRFARDLFTNGEVDRVDILFTRFISTLNQKPDRKSTRLNSSHSQISYAVFCLKKKTHCPPPLLCVSPPL